jgi:hypothetical protein
MTTADLRERGLDPAHILSVTGQAISGRGQAGLATTAPEGVRIYFRSRRAAGRAAAALARVGYQVTRPDGRRRDLMITGWNAEALESRLEAMRTVLSQLSASPSITASIVIEQFRSLPPGSPARRDSSLLTEAHARLRGWVADHCGIHAPHDPSIIPADVGNALRLRATRALEDTIDGLTQRHLRVAAEALPLYQSLRLQTTDDQAKDTAIRRASVIYHLDTTNADSSSPAQPRSARRAGPGPRPPSPGPDADGGSTPVRQAALGFPRLAATTETSGPQSLTPLRADRRPFSTRRPGPSH